MKVNYKSLATSVALAFALLVGVTNVTVAQGRRGRGQERSEENQQQRDQRRAEQEARQNAQRQQHEQEQQSRQAQREAERQQAAQQRAAQQQQREAQRAAQVQTQSLGRSSHDHPESDSAARGAESTAREQTNVGNRTASVSSKMQEQNRAEQQQTLGTQSAAR